RERSAHPGRVGPPVSGDPDRVARRSCLTRGTNMNVRAKMLAVAVAAAVAVGVIATATASAHKPGHGLRAGHHRGSITGYPTQINTVDLTGYTIVTSYTLGN